MSYGSLLNKVQPELKSLFREYETICKGIVKERWVINFNESCLREEMLPTFSKIKNNPKVASSKETVKYRKYLVNREIARSQDKIKSLSVKKQNCFSKIIEFEASDEIKNQILESLEIIIKNSDGAHKVRTLKKLNWLYHGRNVRVGNLQFCINLGGDSFINLSSYNLSEAEKQFLNLGVSYHLQNKYSKLNKKVELEVLYEKLLNLSAQNKIALSPDLPDLLLAEGSKHRNIKYPSIITPEMRKAAFNLKNNPDIVVRKADKSASYVVLNREEYISKINEILSDTSKFKIIKKNPTENIKRKLNKLISVQNALQDAVKIPKIVGDFELAYIYGNVKTHKANNPLRPIISQIPSPTYNVAKQINDIITPYMPNQFALKSTDEFLDLLQSTENKGMLASLDVESLYTNVPILDTIEIILDNVFNHPTIPPPKVSKGALEELLSICTREVPFRCPSGNLYLQIDGVAMGSPLGQTFAGFYMGHLENKVFNNVNSIKPYTYGRYVDDIFLQIDNESSLIALKEAFQSESVLKFTYELEVQNKLPFLDVLVDNSGLSFATSVYHKPTDSGACLNAMSECCDQYKTSIISNYLNRAYKISSSWEAFNSEVCLIRQKLINNCYSNQIVDKQISKFLNCIMDKKSKDTTEKLPVYYQAQMHGNYKLDEKILKDILKNKVKSISGAILDFRFYYRNPKSRNLVMRNNLNQEPASLGQTNVVYKFVCPTLHCKAAAYIGLTQTTLSRRLTCHRQNGGIYEHFLRFHGERPSREQLTLNTSIIAKAEDRQRLRILEALLISEQSPIINKQWESFPQVLKLFSPKTEIPNKWPKNSILASPLKHTDIATSPVDHNVPSSTVNENIMHEYSPRTKRLLLSPINLKRISNCPQPLANLSEQKNGFSNTEPACEQTKEEIPDMAEVLSNFGICFGTPNTDSDHLESDSINSGNNTTSPRLIDLSHSVEPETNLPTPNLNNNTTLTSQTAPVSSPDLSIGARIALLRRSCCTVTHPSHNDS